MTIQLTDAGKRFNRDWIFRNLNYTFLTGGSYAITGNNGSGKSTLLQILAGSMDLSEGNIYRQVNNQETEPENVYLNMSIAAPYIEMVEEMTAKEFLTFHSKFKPFINSSVAEIIAFTGLKKAANKQIRYYSSGMKQRIKLAQAFFSEVPLLLLDEPCTNLDSYGFDLYNNLIKKYAGNKTIVISSNDSNEYAFCENIINMADYK